MFSLIVCSDLYYGIGMKNGTIPFHNHVDMNHFKNITTNHIVIMGRKTWESLPIQPLPRRMNVIISKTLSIIDNPNVYIYRSIEECIHSINVESCFGNKMKFVIGGATIYNYFITNLLIHSFYHTIVHSNFHCEITMLNFCDIYKKKIIEIPTLYTKLVNKEFFEHSNEMKWILKYYVLK